MLRSQGPQVHGADDIKEEGLFRQGATAGLGRRGLQAGCLGWGSGGGVWADEVLGQAGTCGLGLVCVLMCRERVHGHSP